MAFVLPLLSGAVLADGDVGRESAFELPVPVSRADCVWSIVRGCATWEDDCVVLPGGARIVYPDHRFANFVLECEYHTRGPGPTGPVVFYRHQSSSASGRAAGPSVRVASSVMRRPGPRRTARISGMQHGRWHTLRLVAVDRHITLLVDGAPVSSWSCPNSSDGLLALGAWGDSPAAVVWRNVRVTELDHQPLFNGQDLSGWVGGGADAGLCWQVEDGVLVCTGQRGPWLRSEEPLGDFNLRLEYRLREGGNSGVYVRVPEDGNHHGPGSGIEVQILDDHAPRYRDLRPDQFTASLYAIAPAAPGSTRPVGQWNTMEINCVGDRYTITHNGRLVVEASQADYPELSERLRHGWLGLQNHSEQVWFRHLRIGPPR